MEKLLKWSLQSAQHDPESGQAAPRPDEKALNELFGGEDEATQMKNSLGAALNTEDTLENREIAMDNLEMLIEQLDNANNLENMGLWEPLLSLLDDPHASIRKLTCWVAGTATQNNPESQAAFANKPGAVAKLLKMLEEDEDQEVRLKALYALSSCMGHFPLAYVQFQQANGWASLDKMFQTVDHSKLRMRILAFLQVVSTIEPVEDKHQELANTGIVDAVISIMRESNHVDAEEKALHVCSSLHHHGFKFSDAQVSQVRELRQQIIDKSEGGVHPDDVPFL